MLPTSPALPPLPDLPPLRIGRGADLRRGRDVTLVATGTGAHRHLLEPNGITPTAIAAQARRPVAGERVRSSRTPDLLGSPQ
ncbi:transketolase C-terminal domain/subunit [Streptacidiphilus sp. MAP12-16]|uniref:hypothetical protein n=1 Tax=Streptacidiphilus sp. MAP12-16 TaxID=3156300 RepID=UPI0035147887